MLKVPEKYRVKWGMGPYNSTEADGNNGVFIVPFKESVLRVICAENSSEHPWDHVSVSLERRTPTWEEMCYIKQLFFSDDDLVLQFHPPQKDHINHHPFCLHLWRYIGKIPMPDKILV